MIFLDSAHGEFGNLAAETGVRRQQQATNPSGFMAAFTSPSQRGRRENGFSSSGQAVCKDGPEDPEWLRYKMSVVECRALENMARRLAGIE